MNWQATVLPAAIALATALAAGWFQKPKVRAEVSRSETDEEIALRKMRVEEQVELLKASRSARDDAIKACTECERKSAAVVERLEAKYDVLAKASENLADSVQAMLDESEDIIAKQTMRLRLREYRQAI